MQALGIAVVVLAHGVRRVRDGAALLGLGTAMVYPTLLAAIGDVAHPSWRASAVGVYRLWRDLGYAVGALLAGIVADALGLSAAMWIVAALTFASGLLVAIRMGETMAFQKRDAEAGVTLEAGRSKRHSALWAAAWPHILVFDRTMDKRAFKDALYQQFARIGAAVSSPKRLEILDLLCQGEKSVDALAEQAASRSATPART